MENKKAGSRVSHDPALYSQFNVSSELHSVFQNHFQRFLCQFVSSAEMVCARCPHFYLAIDLNTLDGFDPE